MSRCYITITDALINHVKEHVPFQVVLKHEKIKLIPKSDNDYMEAKCKIDNSIPHTLTFSLPKQIYYCFICEHGGDILFYLGKRHGFSLMECIKHIFQVYGTLKTCVICKNFKKRTKHTKEYNE